MSKTAILTGISSGLGSELALNLIGQGYKIIGVSRSAIKNAKLKKLMDKGSIIHVMGDVSESKTVENSFKKAQETGDLNLVINCAGSGVFGSAGTYKADVIQEVLQTNLMGTILFSDSAFTHFKNDGGTIVNIISTAAFTPRVNEAVYCASKFGVKGYTESLRLETKNTPIKIIAVYPGGMNTNFWQNANCNNVDCEKFMEASEVAQIIVDNIFSKRSCYVSDIVINRNSG